MFQVGHFPRRAFTRASVSAVALSLGGCFSGAASPEAAAPVETPVKTVVAPPATGFAPHYGFVSSEGLASRVRVTATVAADKTTVTALDYATSGDLRAFNTTTATNAGATGPSTQQKIETTSSALGATKNVVGLIESDGGNLYRGGGSSPVNDYVYFTNTPSKALESSLGATTLAYSYIGMGAVGARTDSITGFTIDSYVFSLFGGKKTTDMPTTGSATYVGAFEGVEQTGATAGSRIDTSRLSGVANLTADFASKKVSGRIDDLNRYSATTASYSPIKAATDYSLGFSGAITGNSFAGTATLNEKNSNTVMTHTTQTGALQGGFFGPAAAEATGALAVSSTHDTTKTLVTGAFGAKKQ